MISIEAHRAAIGRFYGKAKKVSRQQTIKHNHMGFHLFLASFLILIFYAVFMAFICSDMFIYFIFILLLAVSYGYPLIVICMCTDLLATSFIKTVRKDRLMAKPSLPNRPKVARTLVCCSILETFVLDGRDGRCNQQSTMLDIDIEERKIYNTTMRVDMVIDSDKIYKMISETCYYILLLGSSLFAIYFTCDLLSLTDSQLQHFKSFISCMKNVLQLYFLNHLKLMQLLLDGDGDDQTQELLATLKLLRVKVDQGKVRKYSKD